MPELTDLSVIRALCEKYDFALSKGFGQNFIINPGIPTKIVDASGVDKRYGVIEIGPGIGVLTKELAKRAAKVVSIEVDERLPPLLAETMAGVDNFKLVLQDVLKVDLKALIAEEFPGMPVAVCANLPYYITSPIVMKLLGDRLPIESLTVMVQKEAADRLAAVPGTRASSAISCAVNYYATSKLMFTAAPGSFYPAPKVTSAVVRMDIRPTPAVQVEDEAGYFALFAFPVGVMSGIYMNEYAPKGKLVRFIRMMTNNLSGIPSIVFGLFGMALFVKYMGFGDSILAGSLTLGLLCVPLVIRTTEEALKAIPDSFREGSLALGATKLQTIWHVILPMGMPNIITGLILALGRVSGETAPILFTCAAYFLPQLPHSILDQCMALPYHLYVISTSGTDMESQLPLAYGTALVLILIILIINLLANALRRYFSNKVKTN